MKSILIVVGLTGLLFGTAIWQTAMAIMHDCTGGPGGTEASPMLMSILNDSQTNKQIAPDQMTMVSNEIAKIVMSCTIEATFSDALTNSSNVTSGNIDKIKAELVKEISKNIQLNGVQVNALNNMINDAIVLQEATANPHSPKPEITFELYNQSITLKW